MSSNRVADCAAPPRPPLGGAAGCDVSPNFGRGKGLASVPGVLSPIIHSTDLRISAAFFSQSATETMARPLVAISVSVGLRLGYLLTSTVSLTCAFHLS